MKTAAIPLRVDKKGPKNIAKLLFLSAFIVFGMGWQDWQMHTSGLTDEQISTFLKTPNNQGGEPTSVEQYKSFESDVRDSHGYLVRGTSLMLSAICLIVGSILLHQLKRSGAYLSCLGAGIGLVGGLLGSHIIRQSASEFLGEALALIYEIWVYLCGASMGLCMAMSALPLFNARARLALTPSVVILHNEEE